MEILMELGWEDYQAAAIVGTLMQESYPDLRTRIVGDGGSAYGVAQWRRERRRNLVRFCKENDLDYRTIEGQIYFLDHELNTTERRAGNMIRNADTLEEAAKGAIAFERPWKFTWSHPERGHGFKKRLQFAYDLLDPESEFYALSRRSAQTAYQ